MGDLNGYFLVGLCAALVTFVTSGVRIGTPSVTTQGMKEAEMAEIAALIAEALRHRADASALAAVKAKVNALCARFPVYPNPLW